MRNLFKHIQQRVSRLLHCMLIAAILASLALVAPGLAMFPYATPSDGLTIWQSFAVPIAEADSLDDVRYLIRNYYPKTITPAALEITEIDKIVKSLGDPYTEYMSPQDIEDFDDALNQHFSGVGIRIEGHRLGAFIVSTMPDSPALRAGLVTGDIVVSVDGKVLQGMSISDVAEMIRGKSGSTVQLGIQRGITGQVETITLTRAEVTAPSVEWEMLGQKTAYINVSTFGDDTIRKFDEAVTAAKANGAEKLILDIRGNSGGYFDGGLDLAERFVDGTITYVQAKGEKPLAQRGKTYPNLKFKTVILTDAGSASASEILAAALKDNGFTLIGDRTFGKGVMQRVFDLSDGDYLKMTIAEFFSPKMNKIQSVGVEPTIKVLTPVAQEIRGFRQLNPKTPLKMTLEAGNIHAIVDQMTSRSLRLTEEPQLENGTLFLPAQDILEALGAKAEISKDKKFLVVAYQGRIYSINVADKALSINGGTAKTRPNDIRQKEGVGLISPALLKEIVPKLNLKISKQKAILSF